MVILDRARKVLLFNNLSPGDVVAMTAAVRDLHRAHPGKFITGVYSSAGEIWQHNPYVTKLPVKVEPLGDQTEPGSNYETLIPRAKVKVITEDPEIEILDCQYSGNYPASINRSNGGAFHFIHGYAQDIGSKLGVKIPITELKGDIHLAEQERQWISQVQELGVNENFWIIVAGGKFDFTAKWGNPLECQKVVDHFKGKITFVQCGQESHHHPKLNNVIDLLGKTSIRQFIRLIYHSDGVLAPVTFAMHLAAAVPMRPFDNFGRRKAPNRACVVLAGGREPSQWEAYPHHQYIHSTASLTCCRNGGCWKSRAQKVNDGDPKDDALCEQRIKITDAQYLAKCQVMISAQDVIERINLYYSGDLFKFAPVANFQVDAPKEADEQIACHFLNQIINHYAPTTMLDITYRPTNVIKEALNKGVDAYALGQRTEILFAENLPFPRSRLSVFDLGVDYWQSPLRFDLIWSNNAPELFSSDKFTNFIKTIKENISPKGVLFLRSKLCADNSWQEKCKTELGNCGFIQVNTQELVSMKQDITDEDILIFSNYTHHEP